MDVRADLILIVTNAGDATADFFEAFLAKEGVRYRRLNTELVPRESVDLFVEGSSSGYSITIDGDGIEPDEVGAVYYRRPTPPLVPNMVDSGVARWASMEYRQAWGGFLACIPASRWMNHPSAITQASYKPEQLRRAIAMGLRVPHTVITTSPSVAESFCRDLDWGVIAKPIGHGELRADDGSTEALVYTTALQARDRTALDRVAVCPTLLQERIDKRGDIRVTVANGRAISVFLHSQEHERSSVDCRRDNMAGMRYSVTELPDPLTSRLVDLTRSYGLEFGAIDLAVDDEGEFWFLELNPAGQWAWLELEAGAPLTSMILAGLESLAGITDS